MMSSAEGRDRRFKKMRPKYAFDLMTEKETTLKVSIQNKICVASAICCGLVNYNFTPFFIYSQHLVAPDQCVPPSPSYKCPYLQTY